MKQCPTCRRIFDDDALRFCLDDGSTLVPFEAASSSSAPTVMATFPPEHQTAAQPPARETTPGKLNSQNQDRPHLNFPQPAPVQTKRSPLPWILGIVALLLISGGVLYFALSSRSSSSTVASSNSNSNSSASSNANGSVNANHNANVKNSNNANNSNTHGNNNESSDDDDDSPPTNRDEVLADLSRLEDQWNTANMTGDKETLDDILADDFDSSSGDKKQYIANIKPDSNVLSETISDVELTLDGKKATLRGINTIRYRKGDPESVRFVDSFVWRDGRWQAVGSVSG